MVEIQLDLAPEHFGFEYYRVALRYADDRFNDANFTEFMVVSLKTVFSVCQGKNATEKDLYYYNK